MTKTHQRRAARSSRQAASVSARAKAWTSRLAATELLSNHDWKQLTKTLDGLLSVDFPSPFTVLKLLCPKEVWLVVDLTYVRVTPGVASRLRERMVRAVDALEKICAHAERLRTWNDLYTAFWTRVLTSDMNQYPCQPSDVCVADAIKFMEGRGTHIAFRWHREPILSEQVIQPLRRFFEATTGDSASSRAVPVRVALRFEACELTAEDLIAIHNLLKMPILASTNPLCDATSLQHLSLRSNTLHTRHLEVLTAMLADPTVRRVDALGLDNTTTTI